MKNICFAIAVICCLILIISCNNYSDEITSSPKNNSSLKKVISSYNTAVDTTIISIDGYQCGIKDVTLWLSDHYEAKSGKTIGIWPAPNSSNSWSIYRTKWGFSQIFVYGSAEHQIASNAGYTYSNIMAGIPNYSTYQNFIYSENS